MHEYCSDNELGDRVKDAGKTLEKNTKTALPVRHTTSTAKANPGTVGRGEQCEARTGNSAPRRGPHCELRYLENGSKPGLKRTFRLLTANLRIISICISKC